MCCCCVEKKAEVITFVHSSCKVTTIVSKSKSKNMFTRRIVQVNASRLLRSHGTCQTARNFTRLTVACGGDDVHSKWLFLGAAAGVLASLALCDQQKAVCDAENPAPRGHPACSLRNISYDEFKDDDRENIWVALDGGVYDVTAFLDAHPGGTTRYYCNKFVI